MQKILKNAIGTLGTRYPEYKTWGLWGSENVIY